MRPRAPRPAPRACAPPRPTARRSRPAGAGGGGADCASSTSSSRGRPCPSRPRCPARAPRPARSRAGRCRPAAGGAGCRLCSPNTSAASCGEATACRAIAPAAAASPGSASRMSASAESWPPTNSTSRSPYERLTWNGSPPTSSPPRQATCTVSSPCAVEPPPLGQPGVQHERAGAGHRPDHGVPVAADRLEILDPPERADGQSGSLPGRGLRAHGRFASHMVQYTGGTAKARPGDGSRLTGCRRANTLASGSVAGSDVGGFRVKVARVARPVRRFGALGVVVVLGAAVLVGSAVATPTSDKPDLVPLLPTETGTQQAVAPIYTDTFVRPGRVLYRFSSVIKNLGGAMDLYKDPYDRRRDAGCLAWRQPDHDARPERRADRRHHREPDRRARRVLHLQSQPGPQPLALPAGGPVPARAARWRDPLLGQGRLLHVGQLGQGRRRLDQVLPGQLQGRRAAGLVRSQGSLRDLHPDGHLAQLRRPLRRAVDRPVGGHRRPPPRQLQGAGDRQPERVHRRVRPEQQHADRDAHDPGHPRDRPLDRRDGQQGEDVPGRAAR